MLRDVEQSSIQRFIESHSSKLTGRVLDFGAGRQPWRRFVEGMGGTYCPLDSPANPGSVAEETVGEGARASFDAVICTQVIQFLPDPLLEIRVLRSWLKPGGHLLLTGPTTWPCQEPGDLHRFTLPGIMRLLDEAGFREIEGDYRGSFMHKGEAFQIGYAVTARA